MSIYYTPGKGYGFHHQHRVPTVAEKIAANEAIIEAQAAYDAQGTGRKSLAKYEANLTVNGRLTRREVAAVRRAINAGKTVPAALVAAAS